jgi:hypothetical protein
MSCVVPANQPIYLALIDKAASYPPEKKYNAAAYKKAAENVLNCTKNIFTDLRPATYDRIPTVGPSTELFIYNFITANRDTAIKNKVETPIKETDIHCTIRRSSRLQGKPKVQHYQDNSESEVEDDDETYIDDEDIDEEDVDERKKVIQTIKDVCDKKGWKFSDELISEYDAWRATATEDYKIKQYRHLQGYVGHMSEPAIAKRWTTDFSDSLRKQKHHIRIISVLRKYCDKNKIKYEDGMVKKYIVWYRNPDNKKYTSRTVWSVNGSYTYDLFYYSATCINAWFSTLNKIIVW